MAKKPRRTWAEIAELARDHPLDQLDTDAFYQAWSEWCEHKKQLGDKPYTPIGLKKQLNRLERMGHDQAIEAIDFSTCQNYRGIFEQSNGQTGRASQEERRAERRLGETIEPDKKIPRL